MHVKEGKNECSFHLLQPVFPKGFFFPYGSYFNKVKFNTTPVFKYPQRVSGACALAYKGKNYWFPET